ncbi:hypothetical protein F5Y15DRAFT_29113 [Xylariaceae sp. FL0016]|nr:hypothetical protein F5Y15DRAFT_29113 [Xylariaceae sp. FL0016]
MMANVPICDIDNHTQTPQPQTQPLFPVGLSVFMFIYDAYFSHIFVLPFHMTEHWQWVSCTRLLVDLPISTCYLMTGLPGTNTGYIFPISAKASHLIIHFRPHLPTFLILIDILRGVSLLRYACTPHTPISTPVHRSLYHTIAGMISTFV